MKANARDARRCREYRRFIEPPGNVLENKTRRLERMSRYTGPKFKVSRREGINVTGTTSPRLEEALKTLPGGKVPRRTKSLYGLRLRAKQRVRAQYDITERSFRRFLGKAERMPGPTGLNLLRLMERRLDSVIYRLGLARTRPMARQLVSHGHVMVEGNRVTIPSFLVRPGESIELTGDARNIPVVKQEMANRNVQASWLEATDAGGRVIGYPRREDIDADISENLIVEFYAR